VLVAYFSLLPYPCLKYVSLSLCKHNKAIFIKHFVEIWSTVKKPVRAPRILDLFRRQPTSTEYVKYREENVVTRDASVVVACATSTSTTKKTWQMRTVQIQKIRDFVDVCIDMIEDYAFVSAEVEQLLNESIKLKEEAEILLGSGKGIQGP